MKETTVWDNANAIELYGVRMIQKVFFVRQIRLVHQTVGALFTELAISFAPMLVYTIGGEEHSRRMCIAMAVGLVVVSVMNMVTKRNYPGHYSSIVEFSGSSQSSFPGARIACIKIILYFWASKKYRWIMLSVAIMNQMILGFYFPSDCAFGVLLANGSLYLSKQVSNNNLVIMMLLFSAYFWKACAPIVGALVPMLFAETIHCSLICAGVAVLVYFSLLYIAKELVWPGQGEYELLISCMLACSATLYVIHLMNSDWSQIFDWMQQNANDLLRR